MDIQARNMAGVRFPKQTTISSSSSFDMDKVYPITDNYFSFGLSENSNYTLKESFFYHLKPCLFLLRIVGAFPVTFEPSGLPKFKVLSPITFYTICLYVIIKIPTWMSIESIYLNLFKNEKGLSECIYSVILLSVFTYNIWLPLLAWMDLKRACQYFKNWTEFQMEFVAVTNDHIQLNIRKYLFPLVLVTCAMGLIPIGVYNVDIWKQVVPIVSSLYFFNLIILKMYVFKALYRAGTALHDSFKNDLKKKSISANVLEDYRLLWLRWSRLVSQEDSMFGTLYAFFMMKIIFITVITSYSFLMDVKTGELDVSRFSNSLPSSVGGILLLYFICRNGHLLSDLGRDFQKDLDFIVPSSLSKLERREVKAFLNTIKMNPPVVSAKGFTNVDKTLFIALMSAMVTYLIVLLQFDKGDHSSNDNSENSTGYPN